MRWLWPFLLLSQAAADGPWTRTEASGLPAAVARALCRIRESRRDVRLSDELWFEALPPGEAARAASKSPAAADLLWLADAVFDTHRLSWRDALLPGMDVRVYKNRARRYALDVTVARGHEAAVGESSRDPDTRTFGVHRRRLQMVMLPIMYKLGVITTLLTGLTVLSLKGVTIGVILLMLAVTSVATKVSRFNHYASAYGGSPYDPFDRSSAHPIPPHPSALQDKNIHVHVHTGPGSPGASLKGSPYEQPAPDDGAYWNRGAADEYYDAAAAASPYRGGGYDRPGHATESSAGGAYHRWLI